MTDLLPLGDALDDYIHCKARQLSKSMKHLGPVLDDWKIAQERIVVERSVHGTGFNPLLLFKIGETTHSHILGDFLDPKGSHGQGDLFLRPFLTKLGVPNPESGPWHVAVEFGRVDILIWRDGPAKSAVIVENKSNGATDQPNQIYRYWHREIYLWDRFLWEAKDETSVRDRSRRFHLVYLPTDESKRPAAHSLLRPAGMEGVNPFPVVPLECRTWSPAGLMELWAQDALPKVPPANPRLTAFFNLYYELWKT